MVREYLDQNNIIYIQEYIIENTYFADFYLKEFNSIIEVYGDYWHGNPEIYSNNKTELNEIQISNIKRDKRRNAHIRKMGYDVYIIWETEIKNDIDYFMGKIINQIINKQESATTVRQAPSL
jgi:G:T-mismatch repair DNA endonuclease (very short patch repair protein)